MFVHNFLLVAGQVAVLFALIATGAACRRFALVSEASVRDLSRILVTIVTPALLVHAFQRPFDAERLPALGAMALAACFAHLLGIALARFVRDGDESRERTLRFAVIFSNAGFMGIPLQQAVLGADGVFYGGVFVGVFNLFCWTYGLCLMSGSRDIVRPLRLLTNPGLVGIVLALVLFFGSVRLPAPLAEPVKMLADLNTPVAMIVIGYFLAGARMRTVLMMPKALFVMGLRLLMVPFLVLLVVWCVASGCPAVADAKMLTAVVIAASAPVAALTSVFSATYGRDTTLAAGVVAFSTLLSILTMPIIVGLALTLFR